LWQVWRDCAAVSTRKTVEQNPARENEDCSGCLFLLANDWIMKSITEGTRNGIQWTPWTQLEDLDFAND